MMLRSFILLTVFMSSWHRTFAQERVLRSEVDDLITVQRITILPFSDNLEGIYSRPLEAHLTAELAKMHRFDSVPANTSGPVLSPEELEADPAKVTQLVQGLETDALVACRVTKGPGGVGVRMSLFLSKDGKLFSQSLLKDFKQFNVADVKEQIVRMFQEVIGKLPYSGRVMSRDGNRVTLNLGQRDGLQQNQILSVIQVIQLQRHPKFHFLVSSEKEIIGRLKVLKVDETLSFATVVNEKERGAIQKNAKVGLLDFVSYGAGADSLNNSPEEESLSQKDDSKMVFGKDARAWRPQSPATFGQVGARFGFSQLHETSQLTGGLGAIEGTNILAPGVVLEGELWITPSWTFHMEIKQGIASMRNPRAGSSPGEINQSWSRYEGAFGYTIRFGPHVWSPQVEPYLGYFNYRLFSDSASPEAFMTQQYTGLILGLRGSTPIGPESLYGVGGKLALAYNPRLKETPATSGASAKNSVIQFGLLGYRKMTERFKLQVNLDYEMYSSSFTGTGTRVESATSSSHRYTTLSFGAYYMF